MGASTGTTIGVLDQQTNRCAGRFALAHTLKNLDGIGHIALRDELGGARPAAIQIRLDVCLEQAHARRAAVNHAANGRILGFTKIGDCE